MDNKTFFAAINEDAGYEYVRFPDDEKITQTRDSVDDFLKHWEFIETVPTSAGDLTRLHGRGGSEINIIVEGEYSYVWID